jgi:hypothetical protein
MLLTRQFALLFFSFFWGGNLHTSVWPTRNYCTYALHWPYTY